MFSKLIQSIKSIFVKSPVQETKPEVAAWPFPMETRPDPVVKSEPTNASTPVATTATKKKPAVIAKQNSAASKKKKSKSKAK